MTSNLTMCEEIERMIMTKVQKLYSLEQKERVQVTMGSSREFGHYQCNGAMRLAKRVKLSPRQVAEAIVAELKSDHDAIFSKIEVAGPGFINLNLSDSFLEERAKNHSFASITSKKKERVLIDFSSPNTAKEMHVGHLRSTIIGDCLARVYEFLGFEVLRINHIGNWGTQFGMLLAWIEKNSGSERLDRVLLEDELNEPAIAFFAKEEGWDLSFLMKAYQESKKCFDADSEFAAVAKSRVVALQAHEKRAYNLWKIICAISRSSYQEIYDLLDVKITEMGESFYNPFLPSMVEDLEKQGLLKTSQGAKCVFVEGYDMPLMVQKSDGGYNYDTTDLAAMRYRVDSLKCDKILILTDAGQRIHFELIEKVARMASYLPDRVSFHHVPFGLVLGDDGKKFRTRSGKTEKLIDLIITAIEEAKKILIARDRLSESNLKELSTALGINAIKYADLSTYRVNDVVFSYEKMLRFDGNTAAFLMYSYVRTLSVLRKCQNHKFAPIQITHDSERELLLQILQFDEALERTLADFAPNRLADYLYNLAQSFNAFFRDCRVEGSDHESSRLSLVKMASCWLGKGLELLGLRLVDRM